MKAGPTPLDETEDRWPAERKAWAVVAILFLAYIVSFIDRTVLSLLVEPIKADLRLSDVDIGLVSGLAFGVFYAVMGLPLGWLADRRSRVGVIAGGVAVWTAATAACGLATSFGGLFVARVLVGIGEAALSPAALSLISDLFRPSRRPLAVAVFVTAGSVGGGLAMLFGGALIAWLDTFDVVRLPLVGTVAPWRAVFVLVSLPGLLVLALLALAREPDRRDDDSVRPVPLNGESFVAYLRSARRFLVPHILAMSLLGVVAYGFLAWIPTYFIRVHGWTAGEAGARFGLVFLVAGACGAIAGGALASRLRARGRGDANRFVTALGLTLLVPFAVLAPVMPNAWTSLALFAPVMFLVAFPSGTAAAAIQEAAPAHFRGRITALYYVTMNIIGLSTGALLLALLADNVFEDTGGLSPALSATALLLVPSAILSWVSRSK